MKLSTININYLLALLAIIAGISAAFTNQADRNNLYPDWNYKSCRVENEKIRYLSVSHLADLVYQKEQDMTILDLRDEDEYLKYHIPTAIRYDDQELIRAMESSDRTILFAGEENQLLTDISVKHPGKVYIVKGGIEEWYRIVLFPDFSKLQVRSRQKLETIINRSIYFGGNAQNIQLLNIIEQSGRYREGC